MDVDIQGKPRPKNKLKIALNFASEWIYTQIPCKVQFVLK